MNTELPEDLATTFTPDALAALAAGMEQLYTTIPSAADHPGFNRTCFGVTLYQMAGEQLADLVADEGLEIRVERENNAFLFYLEGHAFTVQRVGTSADTDICTAFPRNFRPHDYDHCNGQLLLFPVEPQVAPTLPPLVLAHVGNDEEGLLALYLCRPRRVRQGVITAWEFAVLINATAQPVAIPPERWVNLPVPEEVARPVLRRKHREVRNEE